MNKPQIKKEVDTNFIFRVEQDGMLVPVRRVQGNAVMELSPKVYRIAACQQRKIIGLTEMKQVLPVEKIYGDYAERTSRVFRTFERRDENLGVMLAGARGMGKTTLIRHINRFALELGMPVIVIDETIPASVIIDIMTSIEQPCIVNFDEFDKNYAIDGGREKDDDTSAQNSLLKLFDGSVGGGKKLFVFAVNDLDLVNQYMVGRPGRIRYFYEYTQIPTDVFLNYVTDNLRRDDPVIHAQLAFLSYSSPLAITYDILSALIDEINHNNKDSLTNVLAVMFNNRSYQGFTPSTGAGFLIDANGKKTFCRISTTDTRQVFVASAGDNNLVYSKMSIDDIQSVSSDGQCFTFKVPPADTRFVKMEFYPWFDWSNGLVDSALPSQVDEKTIQTLITMSAEFSQIVLDLREKHQKEIELQSPASDNFNRGAPGLGRGNVFPSGTGYLTTPATLATKHISGI